MMPAPSTVSACSCVQTVLAKQCAVRLSWRFTSPAIIRSGGMASALTSRCERGLPVSPARPRATFCRKMCLPTEAEIWANVAMARNSRSPSFRPHAQSCGSVDQFGFGSWRSWSDRVNAVANGLDRVLCDCGGLLPLVHQDDPRSVPRRSSRAHPHAPQCERAVSWVYFLVRSVCPVASNSHLDHVAQNDARERFSRSYELCR